MYHNGYILSFYIYLLLVFLHLYPHHYRIMITVI